ncbi:MAG: mandelate racemase/muconate lactonizing enzyme family protein [Mesorhizobium sp.]|uniref:mandelate racemase/muconate lactonizing enzyme family protein n=1 Tax=unclassified Mesorhizobium TaxID=325217 RepID=UPI000F75CB3C|nr:MULTISPECIES: mandelate racemase/muconate lactonizing enzyme family protein [unclassified Mesorhizobium]TGV91356.1 mandelate racemase/muconate lactonizing enzyme family protein [Mesorhizobium sp. M00.F.Ca.ET.158.01.1.1]AZO61093.1 mandelate racemase/muconate lactonizing enzyme family protein [Mesorhizobium sp. M1A.F.Ca.IN.022.06.1.1]MCT2576835.1 mandelate racemase/muconate lactonizing enzyme family protein [Mesorhizobium sp. P13.3]MDF3165773.1 mandelate racemase/muconate lactonizing enzyme fa
MRIKSVQAWWVRIPIEVAKQHRSDFGQVTTFDAAILRVETDDGLVGWGEGKNAAGSAGSYGALVHMLNHEIAPQLIGRDPADIGIIWEMLYNGVRHHTAAHAGHAMPQLARRGMSVAAISAVDIALWDILGKSLGQPVWRLLGGRKVERMQAYASGGWAPADTIGDQLKSYIAKGSFKALKMRIGAMDGAPHISAARVRAAREAIGPDVELMVDAHGTYTVAEAKRFISLTADLDLAWFEEPVIADDKHGMAEVRASGSTPIATGESEATRYAFRDLAVLKSADIFQPDPAFCGGISEAMKIGTIASAFNLRFAPHLWAGAPCFFAGLHVCAASPATFIVEYSLGANPMIHDLVEETVEAKDGMIAIPEKPGLGFTVSERFLEAHALRI